MPAPSVKSVMVHQLRLRGFFEHHTEIEGSRSCRRPWVHMDGHFQALLLVGKACPPFLALHLDEHCQVQSSCPGVGLELLLINAQPFFPDPAHPILMLAPRTWMSTARYRAAALGWPGGCCRGDARHCAKEHRYLGITIQYAS
eukprot:scaffold26799_cov18-Tisochrysis_lutea.AAC.2